MKAPRIDKWSQTLGVPLTERIERQWATWGNGTKKDPDTMSGSLFLTVLQSGLFRKADCLVGANRSAGTALCALVGVNLIDVALGDSSYGALVDAGSACNAVFTNYVSHNVFVLLLIMFLYGLTMRHGGRRG
jgi:hypothetical protein